MGWNQLIQLRHEKLLYVLLDSDQIAWFFESPHWVDAPMGESSGNGESCSYTRQTRSLGGCMQEDRRCAKGSMGEGEGREENGLAGR
jgi:hypothetical protein